MGGQGGGCGAVAGGTSFHPKWGCLTHPKSLVPFTFAVFIEAPVLQMASSAGAGWHHGHSHPQAPEASGEWVGRSQREKTLFSGTGPSAEVTPRAVELLAKGEQGWVLFKS